MSMQVARDGSAYFVVCDFRDEDSAGVVPNGASYTLTNEYGRIINGKDDVTITPLSTQVTITLRETETARADGARRQVIVEATYDSSRGSSLPLVDWAEFGVEDIPHVT